MASNEVRAHRQRFFYCELVASIYLSPLQPRSCDKARCLKIPHEGLCAPYGFVLVCSNKVCLHTVSLAQGSFISWINDSFSGIFTTRLSDNRSLVKGALHSGDWQRTFQKEVTQEMLGPTSDERGPPYASLLMNSATQCLRPEWQHGTGRWVGSGDSEGVSCHLLWCWDLHFSLHKCNRTEKRTTMKDPFGGGCGLWWLLSCTITTREPGHLKTFITNYSCRSCCTSFYRGSIWAVDVQWFAIIIETGYNSACHVCCL